MMVCARQQVSAYPWQSFFALKQNFLIEGISYFNNAVDVFLHNVKET